MTAPAPYLRVSYPAPKRPYCTDTAALNRVKDQAQNVINAWKAGRKLDWELNTLELLIQIAEGGKP
jgi:hypothetical protein